LTTFSLDDLKEVVARVSQTIFRRQTGDVGRIFIYQKYIYRTTCN